MIHIIQTQDFKFKPEYYDPLAPEPITITVDHVAWFYGCQMACSCMLRGSPSIKTIRSAHESLQAIGAVKNSIPRSAFCDMHRRMHFSDNWDSEKDDEVPPWEAMHADEKFEPLPEVAHHRCNFEHIEGGFNRQWKQCVQFGNWITADENRAAGWYKSAITIGSEPKPIRMGVIIHLVCVAKGPLRTYKLHCQVYNSEYNEDLNGKHDNMAGAQKWVNLYNPGSQT